MTGTETMNQHTILATRLGDLTVVRNTETVVGLYFPHHWYRPGPDTFGPRTDEGFDEVVRQLQEYLAGGRREFDLPLQAPGSEPQRRVWDLVAEVPYGQTITYGGLARRLNGDVTPRQVGDDIGRNPLCIFIPCHRVVGCDTSIISGALLVIGKDPHGLTSFNKELLASILLIGTLAGALAVGKIADRIGRRPPVPRTAALFVAGVMLAAFSPSYAAW